MSVVVCVDTGATIVCAADSIQVLGDTKISAVDQSFKKIKRIAKGSRVAVVGGAGDVSVVIAFQYYINSLPNIPCGETEVVNCYKSFLEFLAPFKPDKWDATLFIACDRLYEITDGFVSPVNSISIGSGGDFGLAGLKLGISCRDAVALACELSSVCSLPVIEYRVSKSAYITSKPVKSPKSSAKLSPKSRTKPKAKAHLKPKKTSKKPNKTANNCHNIDKNAAKPLKYKDNLHNIQKIQKKRGPNGKGTDKHGNGTIGTGGNGGDTKSDGKKRVSLDDALSGKSLKVITIILDRLRAKRGTKK